MRRIYLGLLAALLALAAGAVITLMEGRGAPTRLPTPPAPPSQYSVPAGAARVSSSAGLLAALARPEPKDVVLADGRYAANHPFVDPTGHRVYAEHLAGAVLQAGFVLEAAGGVLQGVTLDAEDPGLAHDGALVSVVDGAIDTQLLDLRLDGHATISAGIRARQVDGLRVQRIVARNFRDWGVIVDPNDAAFTPATLPRLEDIDSADVSRPSPRSSNGTAEACVWVGTSAVVRRVKTRRCAWEGLWVGGGTRNSVFEDLDLDDSGIGIYLEHYVSDSTFRRAHIGPNVERGATCEWADPAWDRRPACTNDVFESSVFDTRRIGVYLDRGTTHTTVRNSIFRHQACGAIGNYLGVDNLWDTSGNDYRAIGASAVPVWREHFFRCAP